MVKLHLLVLSLVVCQGVLGEGELHIKNASDLISFSRNVNPGTTTVFLDADIDLSGNLSEQFEPIGTSYSIYFQGTFDGQGHTISNLAINSSSEYVGLFEYPKGATIKNVVLDSSCSVVSSCNDPNVAFVGGVIGYCEDCTIKNTVNMANVSFTGTSGDYGLYLGGFIGSFWVFALMRNCANYGSVTHSGTVSSSAYIGGIIGAADGDISKNLTI